MEATTVYLVMYSHQNLSNTEEPAHTSVMRVFSTKKKAEKWIKVSTGMVSLTLGETLWIDERCVDEKEDWDSIG